MENMDKKVTFVELVDLMAEASSTSKRVCELFLRELFSTISQALINGESVKVNGVGTFKLTQVKGRKTAKNQSDEESSLGGYSRVLFTPDKSLAEAVNQPFAHFDTVILDDALTDEKLAEIDEQHPSVLPQTADADETVVAPKEPAKAPEKKEEAVKAEKHQVSKALSVDDDIPFDVPELSEPAPSPEPDGFYVPFDAIEPAAVKVDPPKEPEPEKPESKKPEPKEPALAKTVNVTSNVDADSTVKAAEPDDDRKARLEELKRKPMLIGRPIDGPSRPVPKQEEKEEAYVDKHFYRPEPRNAYKPSPEQIERASRKTDKRWIWAALAVLAVGSLIWLLSRPSGKTEEPVQQELAIVDSDSVAAGAVETVEVAEVKKEAEKPEPAKTAELSKPAQEKAEVKTANPDKANAKVVTDVITRTEVLTTLAEKYYGSQWFWVYIYEENKAIISNPNNVKPGTRVVIPPAEKYGIDVHNPASLKKAQRRSWELLK